MIRLDEVEQHLQFRPTVPAAAAGLLSPGDVAAGRFKGGHYQSGYSGTCPATAFRHLLFRT
jgi:hypothetical protein